MNDPIVKINTKQNADFSFTLSNVNVSIANGIRRTILTDIPVVGFDISQCIIEKNTTQFINEIIKHRLSCIPVMLEHYNNENLEDILPKQYIMELNVENNEKTERIITTDDFELFHKETKKKVSKQELNKIFPKNKITGDNITFLRLLPKYTDTLLGQAIQLTCPFGIMTAREDAVYNAVSKCTYFNTVDENEAKKAWELMKIELMKQYENSNESKTDIKNEIEFEKKNFDVLDAYRHFKKDSFDFIIHSESFYTDMQIVYKACGIIIEKMEKCIHTLLEIEHADADATTDAPDFTIKLSHEVFDFPSTLDNSYDIIMKNEDYTLGHILQHLIYDLFYIGDKRIMYCGFQKFHPHNIESVLRIAYVKPITTDILIDDVKKAVVKGIDIFRKIQKHFGK